MAYEKQHSVAAEVDRRFPKDRRNPAIQEARMVYNMTLLSGLSPEEAERGTIGWVRPRHPGARL
jgi:hypothetical protein